MKGQSGCSILLGLALLVGLIGSAPAAGMAILLVLVLIGVVGAAVHFQTVRSMKQEVTNVVQRHLTALVRRRAQLLTVDAYGTVQTERWVKEIEYFFNTQVSGTLSTGQRKAAQTSWAEIAQMIEREVATAADSAPAFNGASVETMSPSEFEAFCAERLRLAGWSARVTGRSGDQGVDVLAEGFGVQVALQCKLYSKPIGNKAVQEAVAGRVFYGAQRAAVVSNRPYTPAAEQLARMNSVFLLHYSQLEALAGMVGGAAPTRSDDEFVAEPAAEEAPAAPFGFTASPERGPRSSFGLRR